MIRPTHPGLRPEWPSHRGRRLSGAGMVRPAGILAHGLCWPPMRPGADAVGDVKEAPRRKRFGLLFSVDNDPPRRDIPGPWIMAREPKSLLMPGNLVTFLIGTTAGVVAPLIGVFVGLQVSSAWGTVLMAPYIAVAALFDTYLGNISGSLRLLGLGLSILTYVLLAFGIRHLFRLVMRR